MAAVADVLSKINDQIVQPLIVVLFGLALAYFLWGSFVFIKNADSDEGRSVGKRHIIWGLIGMAIMISVLGILRALLGTFGIDTPFPGSDGL